jgi:glucokinase
MNPPLALVADIGGTHARFAMADLSLPSPLMMATARQVNVMDFPSVVAAAQHYLDVLCPMEGTVRKGVFAVAGRVDGDEARMTNHPWLISRSATADALGFGAFHLVNDFTAQAMAMELLSDDELVVVGGVARGATDSHSRTYGIIGPGTGLGVSALLVRNGISFALETEGGHAGFSPYDDHELAVLQEVSRLFGRVSHERLLSGGGLSNIHHALSRMAGDTQPATLRPSEITERARQGDPVCVQAVQTFLAVFGSIAGDLVLTFGAWDGVFLTGGLVPRLLPELQASPFRERFEAKGRFSTAMARVPTLAVVHPQAGLLGAAAHARNLMGSG